jgi:hypothetical protein
LPAATQISLTPSPPFGHRRADRLGNPAQKGDRQLDAVRDVQQLDTGSESVKWRSIRSVNARMS